MHFFTYYTNYQIVIIFDVLSFEMFLVMTVYRKRRIHQTKNLLTGEADIQRDSVCIVPK